MKSKVKMISIIAIVLIVLVVAVVLIVINREKTKLGNIESVEGLVSLTEKLYEGKEETLPKVETNVVDVSDSNMVNYITGLENGDDLEFLVVSEPLINVQPYSLILAKVKKGVNANEVAKTMSEKVDPRKWICVGAEKIYATSSGDVVFLVMSSEEWAKPVYEAFKEQAGKTGKLYEKEGELGFPEETLDNPGESLNGIIAL